MFDNYSIVSEVHFIEVDMDRIDIMLGQPVTNSPEIILLINGTVHYYLFFYNL